MAYSEAVYAALCQHLGAMPGLDERRMFGGIVFMLNGNMLCGAMSGHGMVRVGPGNEAAALRIPGTFEMRQGGAGRRMKGFVRFEPGLVEDPATIARLIDYALGFVGKMPSK
ncbi:MAG: TfoX/Sxy family protein [Pseudomonadota bacterium]